MTAAALPQPSEYQFSKASVIDRVILAVIEDYYDPERIDAQRMFEAIMNALQKAIAELVVEYDEKKETAEINVAKKKQAISFGEIKSPWHLSRELHRIFKFIESNLPKNEYNLMDIEYGAANAMLSTLDPHSNALPPDIYKYLRMDTAGEFGGLGIRITTDRRPPCSGNLTVVEVFDNTPAMKAGLKKGDQIVRIDDESTVNITTSEAADRLRGIPGTKVKVQIKRQNGTLHNFNITRQMVPITSVEWEMLKEKVGYIKLNAFQENSAEEMLEALEMLHEKNMKGLILDLRENPGGLLHIAINIVNNFLPSGTIVTTAGRTQEDRHVENATADGTEPMYPMVVLIDAFSASAAEIMAGALRNHGRALLIGETTFGKGSVQMVQQIPDGGAIKLTSGQYLTPGDISIQAVGVPPDITFLPVSVDKEEMDLTQNGKRFSEADLEFHLDRPNVRYRNDRDATVSSTLFIPKTEVEADKARYKRCYVEEKIEDSYKGRFETEFARKLIASADKASAENLLVKARSMIEKQDIEQDKAVVAALKNLKIDWSKPESAVEEAPTDKEAPKPGRFSTSAKIIGKVIPGESFKVKVTVTNNSKQPIYRLYGVTSSDNTLLDGREFVFGKIAPKKARAWTENIKLPLSASPRIDDMTIKFQAVSGPLPEDKSISIEIPEQNRPELVYGWQFQDLGNGDGVFQPGEEISMYISMKNIGKGETIDTEVELSAKPGIDVIHGILDVNSLKPDATAEGVLRLRIMEEFPLSEAELTLAIRDWYETETGVPATRTMVERDIHLPVKTDTNKVDKAGGTVTVMHKDSGVLREGPATDARIVALSPEGAAFEVDGTANGFFRVMLSNKRHAWISKTAVSPGGNADPKFDTVYYEPPVITIKGATVKKVKGATTKIEGYASHPSYVRDVMIFAEDQKVLYAPSAKDGKAKRIDFSADVPLKEGANHIIVIARHDDKIIGSESLFIRREEKK